MGNIRHSNNASSLLAAGILAGDTSLTVTGGQGALFPSVGGALYAKLAIEDISGNIEIVHLTGRSGDVLTVTRAQEGTIALAFASGSRVENRVTAAVLNEFIQKAGDSFTGIIDGGSVGQLSNTRINGGETVLTPMRGATGVTTNQLVVPAAAGPPTIGGAVIYTTANLTQAAINAVAFPVGTIFLFHGLIGTIPAGFQACDGTNGTPDMRNKFVVGAGGTYTEGSTGGSLAPIVSGAGGSHTPSITGTALTIAQLPSHRHTIWGFFGGSVNGNGFPPGSANGILGDNGSSMASHDVGAAGHILIENTGSGATHTHTASLVSDHTHTVAVVAPPYVALFFIMKV